MVFERINMFLFMKNKSCDAQNREPETPTSSARPRPGAQRVPPPSCPRLLYPFPAGPWPWVAKAPDAPEQSLRT